ncbi:UDP-N-acetylglucosamine 2-epimerase (non-hydrolyzing) [bacterium]|nr:UDP-N-acetylglucosamine 2-epimerase (non-hydrolyzing) [bacterium]
MKIVTIIGTRPQFIKAATVSRLMATHDDILEVIVHTGQHYDYNMSDIFFDELSIPRPDYNLGVGGSNHGKMTGRQLEGIEKVLLFENPDWVFVYGDTNSTLAGALAAVKLHVPVAHIEAGLRSFNRRMPEEINRILTDHASERLFVSTQMALNNLSREGIPTSRIEFVGDVMLDAAHFYRERARQPNWFASLQLEESAYVLATIHRPENTDHKTRLKSILEGLGHSDNSVIMPLHPRTRRFIEKYDLLIPSNIYITDPVGYLEMVWLEMNAKIIATDSGGVQKEAYFHGKPCLTMRDETEWVELVEAGWNKLVGADAERIRNALSTTSGNLSNPFYGNGDAAEKIVSSIIENISKLI